jgi:hypothetical protein
MIRATYPSNGVAIRNEVAVPVTVGAATWDALSLTTAVPDRVSVASVVRASGSPLAGIPPLSALHMRAVHGESRHLFADSRRSA